MQEMHWNKQELKNRMAIMSHQKSRGTCEQRHQHVICCQSDCQCHQYRNSIIHYFKAMEQLENQSIPPLQISCHILCKPFKGLR